MSPTMACTSCCLNCHTGQPGPSRKTEDDVYSVLDNLLKLGTVSIQLGDNVRPDVYCEHVHTSDDWHPYGGTSPFLPLTSLVDVKLCQELEFLVKHQFINATYRVVEDQKLFIRIYLIPYDLSGAAGVLRNRKDGILTPGRRFMRSLLPRVASDWEPTGQCGQCVIPNVLDRRTLAEIYSEVASPRPTILPGHDDLSARLLNDEDCLVGFGLRSELYRYQRRSVAALIQQELDGRSTLDPVYLTLKTLDGRSFFFQPGTMEVLLDKPLADCPRGGILCEELGTGKTVMIIGLILATLRQVPKPEQTPSGVTPPIMTPLSFRYFPSSDCRAARGNFGRTTENCVPSLVELLLDRSRTSPDDRIPNLNTPLGEIQNERRESVEGRFENLPLAEWRRANVPFYLHCESDPHVENEWGRRRKKDAASRRMYLSSATLVVVPANLLSQWDREIIKHAEIPLRVLMLRAKTEMPSVRELATDYDIILMTYTRFTAEAHKKDTSKLHSWRCKCPEIPGTRVVDCKCQVEAVSPFLQIRWKRLVIDEGHVSASLSTNLTPFAKVLSVERRWIVTGTPTTNLLGLGLGKRTISESSNIQDVDDLFEEQGEPMEVDSHDTFVGGVAMSLGMSTDSSTSTQSGTPASSRNSRCPSPTGDIGPRIWNKYDREDLRKLGNMISHFVAMKQFAADSRLMTTHVIDALMDRNGPRPGAISVLFQLMNIVMIRHRVEDVEGDVVLPPLTHESVLLELDPLATISYNMLQATIAINAVDSERKDQDYLFHPRNTEYLQLTVKNMSQLMFWGVDQQLYNVEELHAQAQQHIQRALDRRAPEADIQLLQEAFKHVDIAANNCLWRATQEHEDILYRVHSMPKPVYDAWGRIPGSQDPENPSYMGFLHADRLLKMYGMLLKKPLIKEHDIVLWGHVVASRDKARRAAYIESQKRSSRGNNRRQNQQHQLESPSSHTQIADNALKKASAKETLKEMQTELNHSMALLESAAEENEHIEVVSGTLSKSIASVEQKSKLSRLATSSCLAPVRIGPSASTKLNHIINDILQYSSKEKFLIFSDSELTLAHIAEALELIHVKFLRFSAQIPPQFREQMVLTFETSETYRVFLMELKHGARGLNLVSASRVIFCEPVWQADVESQAIKRVHRIGQTRPITVKTLAIKGTAEENMVARRHALHNSQDKLPKLIEEAGMRHFIANPKFVENQPQTPPPLEFSLIDLPPFEVANSVKIKIKRLPSSSPSKKRVLVHDPISSSEVEEDKDEDVPAIPPPSPLKKRLLIQDPASDEAESPPKRVRTIRFE